MALSLSTTNPAGEGAALRNGHVALADIEMQLLLEGVARVTGMEFRDFTPTVLKRRLADRVRAEDVGTISALIDRVLHDREAMERLIHALSVNPTTPFKDPGFYAALREVIVPRLRTYPFVRIWHVGCSSGDETFSLAILLREAGLFERCKIYATDISESAVRQAKEGVLSPVAIEAGQTAYAESGGAGKFSDYYAVSGDRTIFDPALAKNIIFAQHNIVSDGSFNEFHVIVSRNVLGNFNKTLQSRVHSLYLESLVRLGYLALSPKETVRYSPHERCYEEIDGSEHIYRRIR